MISVSLHESFDVEHIAGEGEVSASGTSLECRVRPIIHLVEPIGWVKELALQKENVEWLETQIIFNLWERLDSNLTCKKSFLIKF